MLINLFTNRWKWVLGILIPTALAAGLIILPNREPPPPGSKNEDFRARYGIGIILDKPSTTAAIKIDQLRTKLQARMRAGSNPNDPDYSEVVLVQGANERLIRIYVAVPPNYGLVTFPELSFPGVRYLWMGQNTVWNEAIVRERLKQMMRDDGMTKEFTFLVSGTIPQDIVFNAL